jgi:hypothetical protein
VRRKKMTNKRNWLGILAIVLVFEMMVIGCVKAQQNNGKLIGNSKNDLSINGTWESGISTIIFNNGKYESLMNGILDAKGNYITNNYKITMQITQLRNYYDLNDLKLYSRNEYEKIVKEYYIKNNIQITEEESTEEKLVEYMDDLFEEITYDYSLTPDGNTLKITNEYGDEANFVRIK